MPLTCVVQLDLSPHLLPNSFSCVNSSNKKANIWSTIYCCYVLLQDFIHVFSVIKSYLIVKSKIEILFIFSHYKSKTPFWCMYHFIITNQSSSITIPNPSLMNIQIIKYPLTHYRDHILKKQLPGYFQTKIPNTNRLTKPTFKTV